MLLHRPSPAWKACLSFLTRESSPRLRRKARGRRKDSASPKLGTKLAWRDNETEEASQGSRKDGKDEDEDAPGWIDIGIGAAISLVATVADAIGGDEANEGAEPGTATRAHLGSSGGDLRYDEIKGRWVLPGSEKGEGDTEASKGKEIKAPPPSGLGAGGGDGSFFRQRSGSQRYVAMPGLKT